MSASALRLAGGQVGQAAACTEATTAEPALALGVIAQRTPDRNDGEHEDDDRRGNDEVEDHVPFVPSTRWTQADLAHHRQNVADRAVCPGGVGSCEGPGLACALVAQWSVRAWKAEALGER